MKLERAKRIERAKMYICSSIPGISGFQRWDRREYRLAMGIRAKSRYNRDVFKYVPGLFPSGEIEDGHLPGHRPAIEEKDYLGFFEVNPWGSIYLGEYDSKDGEK